MHSTNRANLYRAEKAVISSIIGGQLNDDSVNTCIEALINTNKNCNYNLAKSVNHFPRLLTNIDLSSDVLNLWQKQPKGSLNNPISNTEFINSRDYVENLMGVKLTNIQWRHLNYFTPHLSIQREVAGHVATMNIRFSHIMIQMG